VTRKEHDRLQGLRTAPGATVPGSDVDGGDATAGSRGGLNGMPAHGEDVIRRMPVVFGMLAASAVLASLVLFDIASAQEDANGVRHLRNLETDSFFDVGNLEGVAFPPRASSIFVLDQPITGAATLHVVPKGGNPNAPENLAWEVSDSVNITFDGRARRIFLLERESNDLVVVYLRGGLQSPQTVQRFRSDAFGMEQPQGIAVDPKRGSLFILDGAGPKLIRVDPTPSRKDYDGTDARNAGRISEQTLQGTQGRKLRGLGYNHADGCLYAFGTNRQELYRITEESGDLVSVGELSGLGRIDPKGLVFERSLDQTDDAEQRNLYIASSSGANGQVSEWSVAPCARAGAH
jgi:hypothetical protein